jgi:BTB/POZ domain-containing adapter for CUL3-mediated RhoA degradation protein
LRDEDFDTVVNDIDDDNNLYEMLKEAKFYCIQPLCNQIEQKLLLNKNSLSEPYYGAAIVPLVTSKADLSKILLSTDKPIIRLLINRHNNKYSYTG